MATIDDLTANGAAILKKPSMTSTVTSYNFDNKADVKNSLAVWAKFKKLLWSWKKSQSKSVINPG